MVVLMVVVYYRERIQISISQEKKPNMGSKEEPSMGPFIDLSRESGCISSQH